MPKKKKSRLEKRFEKDWQHPEQKGILEYEGKPRTIELVEIREEKPKKKKIILEYADEEKDKN